MRALMENFEMPTARFDRTVARMAARRTAPAIQSAARAATWAADGKVVIASLTAFWLFSRASPRKRRVQADHLVATAAAAVLLPKLIKGAIDQQRPDRSVVGRDRRGVGKSGNRFDAFPSGHAVHIGAVSSA